jgi:hypothetical protein
MNLTLQIQQFLTDFEALEDVSEDAINDLCDRFGWDSVQAGLLQVLEDNDQATHWPTVAAVFWGAALDGRSIQADKLIALLHHRFDPNGDAENNLVWSITCKLKGVDYLSDYKPLSDPGVIEELKAIQDS